MKIAHVIKATRISGAERHLLILLPTLKASGAEVSLILLEEPARPVDDMAAAWPVVMVTNKNELMMTRNQSAI